MNCIIPVLFITILALACCWSANARPVRSHDDGATTTSTQAHRTKRELEAAAWSTVTDNPSSKYIMDLYESRSSHPQLSSQTNTIRSLPINQRVDPICGQYNFTLSDINATREYVVKSELHLYLNMLPPHPEDSSYSVEIRAQLSNGSSTAVLRSLELKVSGYYVFLVEELVAKLLKEGVTFAVFTVTLYNNMEDYHNGNSPLSCSALKFAYEQVTTDNTPILRVDSFDPKIEQIDISQAQAQSPETSLQSSSPIPSRRRKRDSQKTCSVNNFNVTTSLLSLVTSEDPANEVIMHPLTADIGICGGQCRQTILPNGASNHAKYANLLLNEQKPNLQSQYPGYNFNKCCAPIKFESLQVLMWSSQNTFKLVFIRDMVIKECVCIDIGQ